MKKDADDITQNQQTPEVDASAKSAEIPVLSAEGEEVELKVGAGGETKVDDLARQLDKAKDDYLRLAAEYDNHRKRTSREFANLVKTANESLISDLLEVLDNFERAFKSREENPDFEAYHKGIKLLYDKFVEIMGREGLAKFESVGQPFDPRLHEAVLQVESNDAPPDTVAIEIQPGYILGDKVIRHARVGVVKPKSES